MGRARCRDFSTSSRQSRIDRASSGKPFSAFGNVPVFISRQLQEPSRGTWLWAKVQFKNFFKFFWDDHGYLFWSLVLFSGLILRFAIAFIEYSSKSGVWVGIARGCGANLNILMMLLPLTMAKSTHTRLREIPFILKYFPIDDMIEIHINISKLAAAYTVGHVILIFHFSISPIVPLIWFNAMVPDYIAHYQCFRIS